MRILIIIPAFNEEKNIKRVIRHLKENSKAWDIVVINDGSLDNTYFEAREEGCKVIDLPCNLGIGGAVQTGLLYAKRLNYDLAIQFDGDGQHRAEYIENLIMEIKKGSDLAIGSRFLEGNFYKAPFLRCLGIKFFSYLISAIIGQRITDPTSGFRAFSKRAIDVFCRYYPYDYPEVEAISFAKFSNLKISEVAVRMNKREEGRSSITPMKSIYYALKVTLSLLLKY
ncbi:MAG: glycosyltransferase family 2 protein [Caloramator sp.]|nr:glycosyltransferase family 2 protein [Caloramator sp.]